jgi:hypothetical protein
VALDAARDRRRLWEHAAEAVFVAVVLAAFVAAVAPTLDQPLLENHAFRQTQTAYTARIYHQQGIDLLHPKLPVLGEPFEVPFEFPLLQAAASVVMDAGVGDDLAMRLTGLACFLLTALLLYGLVRHVAGRASAIAAFVAFVATPFALVWSRTSMIEYLATAGAVGFTWATVAWRDSRRPGLAAVALMAGLVGLLVKPTTAAFWILPALAYRPTGTRSDDKRRTIAVLAALALVPLAAAAIWTRHADGIKAASPTTAWLTSSELEDWNFGTFSQRLDRGVWTVIVDRLVADVVGLAGIFLLAVALVAIARSAQRLFWLGVVLAAVLPPLVFTNLYVVHDYYLAAITPALAALIGLGVGYVWRVLPQRRHVLAVAALAGLALAASTVGHGRSYWLRAYDDDPDPTTLSLARQVDSQTDASDRVAIVGLDWSPAVLYFADRWGLMVVDRNAAISFDAIKRERYRHVLLANPGDTDLRLLARWKWLASLDQNIYGLADTAAELPKSSLVVTDDVSALPSGRSLRRKIRVPCGVPAKLPSGERGTLILLSDPDPDVRVSLSDELASLPARRAVFVAPELAAAGEVSFSCFGRNALTLDVLDGAFPEGT